MEEKMVEIARYHDYTQAHIARGLLEAAGIYCSLLGDNHHSVEPYLQVALGGIRLRVASGYAPAAREILGDVSPPPSADEPLLPASRRGMWGALVSFMMYMLGGAPMPVRKRIRNDEGEGEK
jgi:hypothetical protein